jgi:mRNA interferase MazF
MKRGDIALASLQGDYGKPRPVLVVQSDVFAEHASLTVLPLTSTVLGAPVFRVTIEPTAGNGLRAVSQIMVDKLVTLRRDRVSLAVGELDADMMLRVSRALVLWLGIAA